MFKHLLLPADGSDNAHRALEKALAIARAFDSRITAIYVVDPFAFTGVGADFAYGQAEYLSAAAAEAKAALEQVAAACAAAGVPVQTALVEAHSIHKGILNKAKEVGADLIVMGSHGKRGLEKLVLGSVTAQVLSHAHLPVLVDRD
jgi:nucleotide-binding universal stress UspA family protein